MTGISPATAQDYLARLELAGEHARSVLERCSSDEAQGITRLQAQLAPAETSMDADAAWLRWCVHHTYGLSVPNHAQPLMHTVLPLRRRHMTPRPLHRSLGRQLLALLLYRPAAGVLRRLQILTGRVERS